MKQKRYLMTVGIFILLFTLTSCTYDKGIIEETFTQTESNSNKSTQDGTLITDTINSEAIVLDDKNNIKLNHDKTEFILEVTSNDFEEYILENDDFAGMIKINDTLIDYPVVKGDDNDFYLKRNFNKQKNYYGSIFMDYRNFGSGFDKNIIIYGHNMKDDEMFGQLRYYMDEEFINSHPIITFQDLYTTRKYQVFSTYFAQSDGDLITTSFVDTSFDNYLDTIQNLSTLDLNVNVTGEDNIITLVTCSYDVDDGRYFVHAVEIMD